MSKYINQYENYAAYSGDSSNFQYPHAAYLNEEKIGMYDRDMGSVLMRFNDIVGTVTDGTTGLTVTINGLTWGTTISNGYFYYDYNWKGEAIQRVAFNNKNKIKTVEQLGKQPWSAGTTYAFEGMFKNCSNVESINMENVRSGVANSTKEMFYDCSKLTEIKGLDKLETSGITNMNSMFNGCNNLTSLDVSGFNTSKVTDMGSMFKGFYNLTSLDVSNLDTRNVTNMERMFDNCSKFTTLDVSNFNTSNVTNMSCMFSGCRNLTTLDLSNFNTSSVTDMQHMFTNCKKLTSITMNNTSQSTLEFIEARLVDAGRASYVTIHRDGYAWTYVNKQWVSTPE